MLLEDEIRSIINLSNTYIGEAPIDVDNCQWIVTASGESQFHFGNKSYDSPEYIIMLRGLLNEEVLGRCDKVYHLLKSFVGNGFIIITKRTPHFVGRDDKNRPVYSFKIQYQLGGY